MSVYATPEIDKMVAIDEAHAQLVTSLVLARKPRAILELGFGAGESCRAILKALRFNGGHFAFDLVDNWADWRGAQPEETHKPDYERVNFIKSNEREFVAACKKRYEFIFSDADHRGTQEWVQHVYGNLLAPEGILIYHDVTNSSMFPNLMRIYTDAIRMGWHHMLFNYNSRQDERCDRGMLVIFKH